MSEDPIAFLKRYDRERGLHDSFVEQFKKHIDRDFGFGVELADDIWRARCSMASQQMPVPDVDDPRLGQLLSRRRDKASRARELRIGLGWGFQESDEPRAPAG